MGRSSLAMCRQRVQRVARFQVQRAMRAIPVASDTPVAGTRAMGLPSSRALPMARSAPAMSRRMPAWRVAWWGVFQPRRSRLRRVLNRAADEPEAGWS